MKAKVLWMLFPLLFLGILLTSSCSKTETADSSSSVVASFSFSSDSVSTGDTIMFINTSKNASYYVWDFGDGTASTARNPTHSFTSNGVYTVSLVAIGTNGSDSTSVDVVVGSTSIFPGKGITGASLGDTWASINSKYVSADTMHSVEYYSQYSEYLHQVYYYDLGLVFYFWSDGTTISNTNVLCEISILSPYSGITSKGICIDSKISKAKTAYGTPSLYTGSNYYFYYYDSLGIGFFTTSSSNNIDQIEIYAISSSSSSKTMSAQSILTSGSKNILLHRPYQRKGI